MANISETAAGGPITHTGESLAHSALAATVGTTIEWYDFQVYGLAAALIFNAQFFPNFDPVAGTLLSFATFAVGFVARPIGAIIFGHMGDRLGRKSTLITTFMLTGIATLLVGCLPNYESIGALAPALLVFLRLLQGIGLGGEWGGAVLIMTESKAQTRRGLLGSLPQLGSPGGLVIATLVFAVTTAAMTKDQFAAWGWRLPFLLSLFLVIIGAFARISMPESTAFAEAKRTNTIATIPLVETLKTQWREVLLAAGLFLVTSGGFYVYVTFMVAYGSTNLGLPRLDAQRRADLRYRRAVDHRPRLRVLRPYRTATRLHSLRRLYHAVCIPAVLAGQYESHLLDLARDGDRGSRKRRLVRHYGFIWSGAIQDQCSLHRSIAWIPTFRRVGRRSDATHCYGSGKMGGRKLLASSGLASGSRIGQYACGSPRSGDANQIVVAGKKSYR
jgi:MFS family permease